MKKRILSVILAAAVILCVFPLGMFSAFAEGAEDAQSIGKYIERGWDDSAKKVTESEEDIPTGATVITGNTSTLAEGEWYVVASDVTVSGTITVEGTESSPTNLVLMDGYTLTVREGIVLNSGKFLNIYGQKNNTGKIKATGEVDAAGIGGSGHAKSGGTLTVHGGEVSATGGGFGAGIGGGEDGNGGTVTVYGGEVNATGGAGGAGIGGGKRFVSVGSTATVVGNGGKGGNVYIYGGAVTAFANPDIYQIDKCGIGIGYGANATESGKLEINASAIIKAGGNANGAEAVEAYGGERYVQIHYHTGEILKSISDTHHQCPYCGMTEEHSFQNNRCICGKYEKYYIARSWNNTTKKVVSEEKGTPADAKQITAGTTTLTNGWYILTEDVQIPYKTTLTVTGDNVNIILSDGCTLSTSAGIIINNGAVLNIYGQIKDTGKIDADNSTDGAAIDNNGTLNIYGGSVKAKGDYSGAGIGGGENEGGGTVYIYGGTVNALGGGNGGAGIGGGRNGIGGNVYVYGGNVKATGGDGGAGIGGGHHSSSGGNVYVYGGNVEAKGGYNGAGIGGGRSGIGGNVYVYGGNVKATGGDSGAGIGGGHSSKGGNFYFYSGTVEAQSGNDSGMGIGCGNGAADPRKFVINDKAITGIKAGYNSASAEFVSADGYNDERYSYVNIFICANHVDEDGDGWCDKCGKFTVKNYTVLDHAYRESGNEPNNFSGNILLSGDVTLNNPVVINGNVTLYIADTMTLTALKGIVLNEGNSLTITSQTVSGGVEAHGDVGAAGIGGAVGKNAGSLTINGGMSIFAYGGLGAPGIGGGLGGKDGEFIQNGSSVYTENGTGYVHEHTFATEYNYNESVHWHDSICGHDVVSGFGEHNYNVTKEGNVTTYTCKVCGYKEYDYGTYTVTFDLQQYEGIVDEIEPIEVVKNSTFSAPTAPSFDTAVFDGWYEEPECIHKWDFDKYTVTGDITLYAKWIPKSCKVWLYYGNFGEEIEPDKRVSITAHYGQDLPDITPPTREGLVFLGYFDVGEMASGSTQYYDENGKGVREWDKETGVASLIAFWAPGTVTPAHEHTYSSFWTFNETHHWHECTCFVPECDGFVSGYGTHNFGAGEDKGDVTVYTCSDCGYRKTVYKQNIETESEQIPEGIDFYGVSLTLSSDISINFYMTLTDDAAENGMMTFTVGDKTFTATAQYNEAAGLYYFRCPLTSLETAMTVKAEFLYLGHCIRKEYSVKEYVETVIKNEGGKFDTYTVDLCKKIANYSHFAQIYLASVHSGVTIGEGGYPEMPNYGTPDIEAAKPALAEYTYSADGGNENITEISRSLYLDDKVGMNFYVTVKSGYELTESMIKVSDYRPFILEKISDNQYRITVKNIEAVNFGENYTLKIDGEIITASVLSYANKIVNGDFDTVAKNSMAALYEYSVAAVEYTKSLKTFTVEFDLNGMGQSIKQTVKYGGKATRPYPDPVDISPIGLQFGGWFKDEDCTVEWDFDKDVITEDTTIYGKWTEKETYTVTFVMMGHGTAPSTQTVKAGDKVTEPEEPTAEGFTFDGWYKDESFQTAWDFDNDTVTGMTTLYAKWTEKETYTVTFVMMGHGIAPSTQTVKAGGKVTRPADPTAEGFTFDGWYKDANYTEEWDFDTDTVTGDTTLYAKWATPCTVTLYLDILGLECRQLTVLSGNKITLPEDLKNLKNREWDDMDGHIWNFDTDVVSGDMMLVLPPEILSNGYYLIGTLGDVQYTIDTLGNNMRLSESGTDGEYKIDWYFAEGDEIKIVEVINGVITAWYNDSGDYYKISADEVGDRMLYFRPEGNPEWSYTYLTVEIKETPINPPIAPPEQETPTEQ